MHRTYRDQRVLHGVLVMSSLVLCELMQPAAVVGLMCWQSTAQVLSQNDLERMWALHITPSVGHKATIQTDHAGPGLEVRVVKAEVER